MQTIEHNTGVRVIEADASLRIEANSGKPSKQEDFDKVARRRFQDPKPQIKGRFWYIRVWQDVFEGNALTRKRQRIKLAPASTPEREVKKIAAEVLRPMNQGLVSVGSAVNFNDYMDNTYSPTVLRC